MARRIVWEGRKIRVAIEEEALPDGRTVRHDVILHPGAVVILPVLDARHVCLLRNVRPVVGEELWEVPAGTLEPGEPPDQAAVRELIEETGYRAASWRRVLECYPSPGVLNEKMILYVAEGLTPGPQQLEPGEAIEVHTVPLEQALAWCLDGTIRDAKTIVALFAWQRLSGGGQPAAAS
jgi:ADP-ribose pyrophosphatase